MLLSLGNGKNAQSVKLPKLNEGKSSTAPKATRRKGPEDDSLVVAELMAKLFSKYDWRVVTTEADLIKYIEQNKELGFDTETTGLSFTDRVVGFSLGTADDCIYVPLAHKRGRNYEGDPSRLTDILAKANLWGFNAKFDLEKMKTTLGVDVKYVWCGYLAARIMNSSEKANNLKDLYVAHVDPDDETYHFGTLFKNPFDFYDPQVVGGYAAVDAMKHIRLGMWQKEHMTRTELKLLTQLELPLMYVLADAELKGITLDVDWCNGLADTLQHDLDATAAQISQSYPGLNPGSPKQVAEWLYDKLGLPDRNGRKVDESTLRSLHHPLADAILDYRKAQKLRSTYAAKMPDIAVNGVVHCTYNQIGADTGRFSSEHPNLQNIPKDNRFRKMFIARPGHTLVSCDYSQQEVYILAALADDPSMRQAYESGMDFYAFMASLVFEKPYEQCVKHAQFESLRNQMKSVVLGLNYDMGIYSLAETIGKSVEETQQIYDKFFLKCPKVKEFRNRNYDFAVHNGYVQTVLGRRRFLPVLTKPDFEASDPEVQNTLNRLKSKYAISKLVADATAEGITVVDNRSRKITASRAVVNSIIQGSAADMTKLAMLAAYRDERLKKLGCQILLQIHDEIIAEFPDETAEEGGKLLAELMVDVGSDLIGLRMKCEPSLMKVWQKD